MPQLHDAFAEDYFGARAKFLAAAKAVGARVTSAPCPAPGPGGETLTLDAAWPGDPAATRVMVVSSGGHGIEGFAGSAIQIDHLLRAPAPPSGVAVLLIHAVNPYGMAWTCLETEDDVDRDPRDAEGDDDERLRDDVPPHHGSY